MDGFHQCRLEGIYKRRREIPDKANRIGDDGFFFYRRQVESSGDAV